MSLSMGDFIRDIEDGDCYYEGVVIALNPLKYTITSVVWCGDRDEGMNGEITKTRWWHLEKLVDSKWVKV